MKTNIINKRKVILLMATFKLFPLLLPHLHSHLSASHQFMPESREVSLHHVCTRLRQTPKTSTESFRYLLCLVLYKHHGNSHMLDRRTTAHFSVINSFTA